MTRKVLLVDDDAAVRDALAQTLELNEFEAVTAASFIVAKDHITPQFDGVIVSDIRMPGRDALVPSPADRRLGGGSKTWRATRRRQERADWSRVRQASLAV